MVVRWNTSTPNTRLRPPSTVRTSPVSTGSTSPAPATDGSPSAWIAASSLAPGTGAPWPGTAAPR